MLHGAGALRLAIDLMSLPSRVRSVRSEPLPDDVRVLLRIASGDETITHQAAQWADRPPALVREAAAFFIEQILLYPGADSYRVLGSMPEAPYSELRHNMTLLLRWLHPDRDPSQQRAVFSARVTRAWNDLKTKDRRAAYDLQQVAMAKAPFRAPTSPSPSRASNRVWRYGQQVPAGSRRTHLAKGKGVLRRFLEQILG